MNDREQLTQTCEVCSLWLAVVICSPVIIWKLSRNMFSWYQNECKKCCCDLLLNQWNLDSAVTKFLFTQQTWMAPKEALKCSRRIIPIYFYFNNPYLWKPHNMNLHNPHLEKSYISSKILQLTDMPQGIKSNKQNKGKKMFTHIHQRAPMITHRSRQGYPSSSAHPTPPPAGFVHVHRGKQMHRDG